MNMTCSCGGNENLDHLIGEGGCLREVVKTRPRKISCEDAWFVDGRTVTDYTLKQQRMYSQHPCGRWSRPKGGGSVNSLPDET